MSFSDVLDYKFSLDCCPRKGPFVWHNLNTDGAPFGLESGLNGFESAATAAAFIPKPASSKGRDEVCSDDKLARVEGAGAIAVAGQSVTGDPLESVARGSSAGWQLSSMCCPVPKKAIPKLNLKKGTTTLGFVFKNGIIIAVDSRASSGQYVASQTVQKVLEINDYLLGTMAGGAADCQYWERVLGVECRLWELRNGCKITVAAASKILANITYSYRNHGLSMGTMIAGWEGDKNPSANSGSDKNDNAGGTRAKENDTSKPSLYYVDDQGSRIKHDIFSVGSGSIYAYGVLDGAYKPEMETEEAIDLARRAIFHATFRDGGSGGFVSVYHIFKGGWKKISRDDQTLLYQRYARHA